MVMYLRATSRYTGNVYYINPDQILYMVRSGDIDGTIVYLPDKSIEFIEPVETILERLRFTAQGR